ncbi:MAG: 1-acyl-sn-glycerol-3-phosphate acyltransferase [Saprospiraceae bacterium]|nr:1-acyl-sn-glycerol-3-phosphate acyltransferase [Saprospiraceae bacterium]
MLYFILRPLTRWAFLAFYRRIYWTGHHHIPKQGPLIFTVNHPTAFVEPCFLASFGPRVLHFMTRGDVFTSSWVHWLLRQVHLIPIYRFHDGFSALRQNEASFAKARKILSRGGAILIMAEGRMGHEKRLRPLQKGAARIGFGAMEEFGLTDVMIQPIGVNYTYADRARKEIMVDVAEPFSLAEYLEGYRAEPQQTLERVTAQIASLLKERVVHIQQRTDEPLAEQILQLVRNHADQILPVVRRDRQPLLAECRAMDVLNALSHVEKTAFSEKSGSYFGALEQVGLPDETVARDHEWTIRERISSPLILSLFAIIWPLHWPPIQLGRWITHKTVRIIEFRSSVLLGSIMIGWALWWFLLTALMIRSGWIPALVFLVLFPLSAGTAVWSREWICRYRQARKWSDLSPAQRQLFTNQRGSLVAEWARISEKFIREHG